MLDGLSRLEPLVQKAKSHGMDSLAITDHGGLYGAIDFYRIARSAGVKPIIGCEMYVAPGSRLDRDPQDKSPFHLTVLAKDAVGYRNLVKLVTRSHLEGFYYKPRVDKELLQRHHEGLVVLSGCPSGEVPKLISQGRMEEAATAANWYRDVFGDYYLEMMNHDGVADLPAINRGLVELHGDLGIDIVATNDSHYVEKEDAPVQDILICIHTNTNVEDERRLKMGDDSYYLKSADEMSALFAETPEAIANTRRIADMCNLELDFDRLLLPEYDVPGGLTADAYLNQLSQEGLSRRIGDAGSKERERLDYELDVIRQTQYSNYFLVVWDIARYARENDIYLAVRGSAAGSLVLYSLGVTDANPLDYGIVFERFLNVERKEMPDIDMDFQDDRRDEVLHYVVSRYGSDNVAQIITFGTLGAKASIRDVGRALAMPYAEVDRIAKLIPNRLKITLDESLEMSHELQEVYGADEGVKRLIDTARKLEGITRHASTHAAGVVISKDPLDTYVPLQKPTGGDDDSISMTQYAMEPIAALGLLKMDLLGLVNLTILAKGRDLIEATTGSRIELKDIPLDDAKTFGLLSRGETAGVFQLEGSGMTSHIQNLKPSSLMDVASMIALYRPGPMEHITTFIEAKHGRVAPKFLHESLRDILEETYGVIVYQDQVFFIAQAFAGYSLGEADIFRKAMGKKVPEIMSQERDKFVKGGLAQGYDKELVEQVFGLIEPFAGYGFPKAHAVSYALISYWTAYLKANYPEEYIVCVLNAYAENTEKVAATVAECRRLRIPVLKPDISKSQTEFSIEPTADDKRAVRVGLASIKNVGRTAVAPVIESRGKAGAFTSIEDMCRKADLSAMNRKSLESLIKAGALDEFGNRGALLDVVDRILSLAQSEARLSDSNQASMFDLFGESVPVPLAHIDLPESKATEREVQAWEIEVLGVSFSGNALLTMAPQDGDDQAVMARSQVGVDMAGKRIELRGQVASAMERTTKESKRYMIVRFALFDGEIEVFVWDNVLAQTAGLWETGSLLTVLGTVRARDDRVSISCISASEFRPDTETAQATETAVEEEQAYRPPTANGAITHEPAPPTASGTGPPRLLTLRINESAESGRDALLLDDLKRLLLEFRGEDNVRLEIASNGQIVTLDWPLVRVKVCPPLEEGLKEILSSSGHVLVAEA